MSDVTKTAQKRKKTVRKGQFNGTPGPGRPKGLPNKVTQELGEAARTYTIAALETLYHVALNSENDSARVSAACALLDRGHGKPKQQIEAKMDGSEAFLMVWQAISEGRA